MLKLRPLLPVLVVVVASLWLATASVHAAPTGGLSQQWPAPPPFTIDVNKTYTATIKTSLGDMSAELYVKDAPLTVNNFVFLARQGFYGGVIFHRIIKQFMVQTGDPTGTGRGGPGYKFDDELSGPQTYTKGTLAMANAGPNTQGSQFFICDGAGAERLPKNYTIFGRVTDGLDVLDAIASVPVQVGAGGEMSAPMDPPTITTIEIAEQDGQALMPPAPPAIGSDVVRDTYTSSIGWQATDTFEGTPIRATIQEVSATRSLPARSTPAGGIDPPITARGKFVIVLVTVENVGMRDECCIPSFKLRDGRGRLFGGTADKYDNVVQQAARTVYPMDLYQGRIQPNLPFQTILVYDVPADAPEPFTLAPSAAQR